MSTERWLTLPMREGIRSPELASFIESAGKDYNRVWDSCQQPDFLVELAAAAGLPIEQVLTATAKCCTDAWSHWSGGATDVRPLQVVNGVEAFLRRDTGFEGIWSTWELAEQVRREVRDWHAMQQGAVVANAILQCVEAVHLLVTVTRNLAQPETGHDQYDGARYERKNEDESLIGLLHDAADAVKRATLAGAWFHSHSEPHASAADHEAYAQQIMGFVIRQAIPGEDVVHGLRERLA